MATYQIFVKLLDGTTSCLQFPTSTLSGETLIRSLSLPSSLRLLTGTLELTPQTLITASAPSNLFPSVVLLPRLRGGKGGFGSLLRGAATKAGQKKTNNFDACRDMSGRRLRHVNAEKKLEEWNAEAEDRRMVKLAEEFLRKKEKEVKKGKGKDGEVEKYLEKYREDSEKCMEAVDESVRESFKLYVEGKRKALLAKPGGSDSKRRKIWMGKKKVDESDSDEDDEDDDDKKSVVLNDGNGTRCEDEGTSTAGLALSATSDGESSGRLSEESNLEEVGGISPDGNSGGGVSEDSALAEVNGICDIECNATGQGSGMCDTSSESDGVIVGPKIETSKETVTCENSVAFDLVGVPEKMEVKFVEEKPVAPEIVIKETVQAPDTFELEDPLDFGKYSSAAELEVLGMERLKAELQSHGLKCGGTLQERAARLFLLKTTPLEKLPKKVLAAKTGGK